MGLHIGPHVSRLGHVQAGREMLSSFLLEVGQVVREVGAARPIRGEIRISVRDACTEALCELRVCKQGFNIQK